MKTILILIAAAMLAIASLMPTGGAQAADAESQYPDMRTGRPHDLSFDQGDVGAADGLHHLLRFANTAWNSGQGPLEIRGVSDADTGVTNVYQRVFRTDGTYATYFVGQMLYHPQHAHWHFEDFAQYELWTLPTYATWTDSGRTRGLPFRKGEKTTFCIMDTDLIRSLPGTPPEAVYQRICGTSMQGMSVGWGDTYGADLYGQWVDLGLQPIASGKYVLRSVVDPENRLYESPDKSDPAREGERSNEAATFFVVEGEKITVDSRRPTVKPVQTVVANNASLEPGGLVAATLSWSGADDVSGVARYELQQSVDGGAFITAALSSSTATSVSLRLAAGLRTYQFRVRAQDRVGSWSNYATGPVFKLQPRQEFSPAVTYYGAWTDAASSGAYADRVRHSAAAGAASRFRFSGGGAAWVTTSGPDRGRADVYLDGVKVASVDLYSPTRTVRHIRYVASGLDPAVVHTLEVRSLGAKNAASTGNRVDVDAFIIQK